MQTHNDSDFRKSDLQSMLSNLKQEADKMTAEGSNQITAGKPGELSEFEFNHKGFRVKKLPDDENGVLRISIGGVPSDLDFNYCVIRGDRDQCIELLRKALKALKHSELEE